MRTCVRHAWPRCLDECFKDEKKLRVHRGRRYLNKKADIQPSSLSEDLELPETSDEVPTPSTELATTADGAQDFGPNVIAFRPRRLA